MSGLSAYHGDVKVDDLMPPALLREMFLAWGIGGSKAPAGWFKLRLDREVRWFSINSVQGMLEETMSYLEKTDAAWRSRAADTRSNTETGEGGDSL